MKSMSTSVLVTVTWIPAPPESDPSGAIKVQSVVTHSPTRQGASLLALMA